MEHLEENQRPLLLSLPIRVHNYDIDAMGIVSNLVYVRWFEDLRMHFLDTYYPFEKMLKSKQSPILARTEVDYRLPLTIYDRPEGWIWVGKMGRAKWEMHFEITSEGKTCCQGKQHGYFYDLVQKRPIALPDELVAQYEAIVDTGRRDSRPRPGQAAKTSG